MSNKFHEEVNLMARLRNDNPFPSITASAVDGETLTVPSDLGSEWVTLLFYRGEW